MGLYDQSFKSFGDNDPVATVHLLGGVPWEEPIQVTPLDREVWAPIRSVDQVYRVERASGTWIYHFEAETYGESGNAREALRRAAALGLKYVLPIATHLILLSRDRPAHNFPTLQTLQLGKLKIEMELALVRTWEIDPAPLLARDHPSALPWVPLLKCTEKDVIEAARRIEMQAADERNRLRTELSVLSGLRYNKDEFQDLLLRVPMRLSKEVISQSWAVKPFIDEWREEGRQEGRLEAARAILRGALRHRFAELADLRSIDEIPSADALTALVEAIWTAPDADTMRRLIEESAH